MNNHQCTHIRMDSTVPFLLEFLLCAFLFFATGCSKADSPKGRYTLNKNIFINMTVEGNTYTDYGYLLDNQQPQVPEIQFIKSSEIMDSSTGVKYTVADLEISEGQYPIKGIVLGQIRANLSFKKPGTGITGTYRQKHVEPLAYGGGIYFLNILPSQKLSWLYPTNDVEFTISREGLSAEGPYVEGNFQLHFTTNPALMDTILVTGNFHLYLKK